jgi:hypothetical protein
LECGRSGYRWRIRKQGENAMEKSDKLQFVAGFHYSSIAESHDKLKFVGPFWIRQRYPERPHSKGFADLIYAHASIIYPASSSKELRLA